MLYLYLTPTETKELVSMERWSEKEDNKLREIFETSPKAEIIPHFKGRNWLSISRRAIRLGLKRSSYLINEDRKKRGTRKDAWTKDEENLLREIYENNTKSFIIDQIKRPWKGIFARAKKLGFKRDRNIIIAEMTEGGKSAPEREDFWTKKEDEILTEVYPTKRKKEIHELLKNRTWSAIRIHAIKLGVQRDPKLALLDNTENSQATLMSKYGVISSFSLEETKNKIREVHREKRGVDYPTQSKEVRDKVKKTIRKKYGVDNVFQSKNVKTQIKKTCLEKYGSEFPTQNQLIKEKILNTAKQNNSFSLSDEEVSLFFVLKELDENIQTQIFNPVVKNTIDFYSPKYSVWIQFDGYYWHGKNLGNSTGPRAEKIQKTIERDLVQNEAIPNLVRFWSDDLSKIKNTDDLKSYVKSKLEDKGQATNVCHQYLKKKECLEIDKSELTFNPSVLKASSFELKQEHFRKEISEFINKYEWLGTVGVIPKWCFTARYNGILAGVVLINEPTSYSKILGEKTQIYEALIQRGATASWTPKNLGSRLIMFACKWMVKNTSKRAFIGYGDPKANEIGTIYQACNFEYLGNSFGSSFIYQNPNIKKGIPFSAQLLKRTSYFKIWCRLNNVKTEPDWFKENGFKNVKTIPKSLLNEWYSWGKNILKDSIKIEIDKKHKYVLILGKNNKELKELNSIKRYKTLKYPKRNNSTKNSTPLPFKIKFSSTNRISKSIAINDPVEIENLKKLYHQETVENIAKKLNKTKSWVRYHIKILLRNGDLNPNSSFGITKSRVTNQKIDFIRENRGKMSRKDMAEKLGESERWVKRQINKLISLA